MTGTLRQGACRNVSASIDLLCLTGASPSKSQSPSIEPLAVPAPLAKSGSQQHASWSGHDALAPRSRWRELRLQKWLRCLTEGDSCQSGPAGATTTPPATTRSQDCDKHCCQNMATAAIILFKTKRGHQKPHSDECEWSAKHGLFKKWTGFTILQRNWPPPRRRPPADMSMQPTAAIA